jgi:hypothetical protein
MSSVLLLSRVTLDNRIEMLSDGYTELKKGTLYKTWAKANPGEASKLDTYVETLKSRTSTTPPSLATATGKAFVYWASMARENTA